MIRVVSAHILDDAALQSKQQQQNKRHQIDPEGGGLPTRNQRGIAHRRLANGPGQRQGFPQRILIPLIPPPVRQQDFKILKD
jgi:hypothetical protein